MLYNLFDNRKVKMGKGYVLFLCWNKYHILGQHRRESKNGNSCIIMYNQIRSIQNK